MRRPRDRSRSAATLRRELPPTRTVATRTVHQNGVDENGVEHLHAAAMDAADACERSPFSPKLRRRLKTALQAEDQALLLLGFGSYAEYLTGSREHEAAPTTASAPPPAADPSMVAATEELDAARAELTRERVELTQIRATLADDRSTLQQMRSDAERESAAVHATAERDARDILASAELHVAALSAADHDSERKETQAVRAQLDQASAESRELRARLEREQADAEKSRNDIESVQAEVVRLRRVLATAETETTNVRNEASASRTTAQEHADQQVQSARAELDQARAATTDLVSRLAEHQATGDAAERLAVDQTTALRSELHKLRSRLEVAQAENTAAATDFTAEQHEIEELRRAATAALAEAAVTAAGIRALAIEERQTGMEAAELQVRALAANAGGSVAGPASDHAAERARMAVELEQLASEVAVLTEARQRADLDLEDTEDRLDRLQTKRHRLKAEIEREREQFRREREAVERSTIAARDEAAVVTRDAWTRAWSMRRRLSEDVTTLAESVGAVAQEASELSDRLARLTDDLVPHEAEPGAGSTVVPPPS